MESDPPFQEAYKSLFGNSTQESKEAKHKEEEEIVEEYELPLIDLSQLYIGGLEREECKANIARASIEWGFFQATNHGISSDILESMRCEQAKVFKQPFLEKASENFHKFPAGSYRWGTPTATCWRQLSWSEAFHIPIAEMSTLDDCSNLSSTIKMFAARVSHLTLELAEILAEKLGHKSNFFKENCLPTSCYVRMNRYPPCPISSEVYGLMPHTDSDFLTILLQDQVGGLQLVKDGKWIAVKPNPDVLIVNIGDLFQAWSNNVYKSVEHRVVCNAQVERLSTAYFFCPSYDTLIESCFKPSAYTKFSFRQYRQQVQDDVQQLGYKVGLHRFVV